MLPALAVPGKEQRAKAEPEASRRASAEFEGLSRGRHRR